MSGKFVAAMEDILALYQPVGDTQTLQLRVHALEAKRNDRRTTSDWQFTSCRARVKLKKMYPSFKAQLD
jgi:hypothetical protein